MKYFASTPGGGSISELLRTAKAEAPVVGGVPFDHHHRLGSFLGEPERLRHQSGPDAAPLLRRPDRERPELQDLVRAGLEVDVAEQHVPDELVSLLGDEGELGDEPVRPRIASTRSASSFPPNACSLISRIAWRSVASPRGFSRGAEQRRLGQQRAERLRLERVTLGASRLDLELVEDRLRLRVAPLGLPLRSQPAVQLLEAVVGVEDTAHDELRRDRSVPVVLLQAERDVVTAHAPEAVELRALAECDRTARVASVALHAEAQMLPVPDRRELPELAPRRE